MKTITRILLVASAVLVAGAANAEMNLPKTGDDHLTLAKSYADKAASWRKEAQYHREMAEAYKRSVPPPDKSGKPNPWAKKMEDHCRAIWQQADQAAVENDKMAEYHTMRARELQGK